LFFFISVFFAALRKKLLMAYSSGSAFYGHPHTNYVHGLLAPPNVAVDSRRTAAQLAINDLTGISGIAPRAMQQYSAQDMPTMGTPAMSTQGIGSPEIASPMAMAIEQLTIFRAEEVFPSMLGPGGVAPLTQTNDKAVYFSKLVFNHALPDIRPIRGRVNFTTSYRQQRISTMRDYGIGLEFTYQFLKGREGPLYLRLSIEQLNNAVVDHLLLMAYDMLQSAVDWGAQIWNKHLTTIGSGLGAISVLQFLRRDVLMLGAIQKEERPLEALVEFIRNEQRKEPGAMSDALVMHHRIESFIAREIPAYSEWVRAGADGPAANKASVDQVIRMHMPYPYTLNVVRAYSIDDAQEFPFMQNEVRYGEFYVMESDVDPENDPNGDFYCNSIEVYNQENDSNWAAVKLVDALKYSGRFDPITGAPIGLAWPGVPFVEPPNLDAYDLFTTDEKVGDRKVGTKTATTIGDMRDIPRDRLIAIANAIQRVGGGGDGGFNAGRDKISVSLPPAAINPVFTSAGVARSTAFGALYANLSLLVRHTQDAGHIQLLTNLRTRSEAVDSAVDADQMRRAWDILGSTLTDIHVMVSQLITGLSVSLASIDQRDEETLRLAKQVLPPLEEVMRNYLKAVGSTGSNVFASGVIARLRTPPPTIAALGKRIERELIGTWVKETNKRLKLVDNHSAALIANGSLKHTPEGYLETTSSTLGARYALAVLQNSANKSADEQKAHDVLLHGLSYVSKSGTPEEVGARFEAFTDNMIHAGVLPDSFVSKKFSIATSPAAVSAKISAYMKSDEAKRAGVFGAASHRDFSREAQAIESSLAYGGAAEFIDTGIEVAAKMPVSALRTNVDEVNKLSLNLHMIEQFIAHKIPLPFRVVLLRPYIRLITYGMIACFNGAQRVYYGMPIFSWLSDGHSQVTRGVLSYTSGAVVQYEKTIFHLPNVLIADVVSGWGIRWRQGGDKSLWDNPMHRSVGDMIAMIEPLDSPLTRTTEIITAYGSFSDVSMLRDVHLNSDQRGDCFRCREWMRTWFGVENKPRALEGEVVAAYSEGQRSEHMICWNGGYRVLNPKLGKWMLKYPSGPFRTARWYGPGMLTAFQNNKRPALQEMSHLEIMGK
jgi:hypothetical protein